MEKNKSVNSKYVGISWQEYKDKALTKEEQKEIDFQSDFIIALSKLRKEKRLTQKDIEFKTGIKQSSIAKIERGTMNPSIGNVLKILGAMGKTLKIVDIK